MPEDYQAVLNDLGVDTSADAHQAPATQDTTPVNPQGNEPSSNPTPSTTPTPVDDNEGDEPAAQQPTGQTVNRNRSNDAFAALRAENGKYKKFMQQLMQGAGYQGDEESFIENMRNVAYQRQAQRNQVSPEILKRMDDLESQNKTLIDSQNRQAFVANLSKLQSSFGLSNNDLQEFLDLAVKENIDLTVPGTNFVTLYQGLFFDKLKDKMIEEERQKWIGQNNKANSASNPDGKSGKKDPAPTDVNTMAEFDRLLQSIPKE